jgi:hypothetical protein
MSPSALHLAPTSPEPSQVFPGTEGARLSESFGCVDQISRMQCLRFFPHRVLGWAHREEQDERVCHHLEACMLHHALCACWRSLQRIDPVGTLLCHAKLLDTIVQTRLHDQLNADVT